MHGPLHIFSFGIAATIFRPSHPFPSGFRHDESKSVISSMRVRNFAYSLELLFASVLMPSACDIRADQQ